MSLSFSEAKASGLPLALDLELSSPLQEEGQRQNKRKCATVRPMGAKRAMKEPATIQEKFLQAQQEVHHLLSMCFHP